HYTRVDHVPSVFQLFVPMDAAVRARADVGAIVVAHSAKTWIGRSRPPQKLVDLSRRAVRQKNAAAVHLEAQELRESAHPSFVLVRSVFGRVVIRDLREMIVARVGVAAIAIGGTARQRLLVVAL